MDSAMPASGEQRRDLTTRVFILPQSLTFIHLESSFVKELGKTERGESGKPFDISIIMSLPGGTAP